MTDSASTSMNLDLSHLAVTTPPRPSKWNIIPVHSSDRASFKFCRRQWAWGSPAKLNLIPRADVQGVDKNLWFGTGIHYALESFYNPILKRDPVEAWLTWFELQWRGGIVTQDEVKQFADRSPQPVIKELYNDQWHEGTTQAFKVEGLCDILPDTVGSEELFMGMKDLGVGMMKFYKDYADANDNFSVVSLEHDFSVPVMNEKGEVLYAVDNRKMPEGWEPDFEAGNDFGPLMKEITPPDQGYDHDYDTPWLLKQVHVRGRMDMILQEQEYGRYGIMDHKAQPLDELILTPLGFKSMGSLSVGDEVIGSDGSPTKILNIFPQGELDCYEIEFSDGTKTRCSKDHLWSTFSKDSWRYKEPKVRTLEQIMNYKSDYGWQIPLCDAIQFEKQNLELDPYLLGVLLGDGSFRGNSPIISCTEEEIINEIVDILPVEVEINPTVSKNFSWVIVSRKNEGSVLTRTRINPVMKAIRNLGLESKGSYDKFIPVQYLYSSIEDRIALLQGLLDTDGNVYEGRATFKTTSTDLVEGIEFLVRSLGGITRTNWNGGTNVAAYRVHISLPSWIVPFRLTRKLNAYVPAQRMVKSIVKIKHVGKVPMQCIEVEAENGLYLTTDFIVTHNTASAVKEDYFRHLELDEQCTSYLAFGELEAKIYDLAYKQLEFITYQALLKGYPKPPTITTRGLPSLNRNDETTTAELFATTIKNMGLEGVFRVDEKMQNYYTYLLEIGDSRYIQRTDTWRNHMQRKNAMTRLYYEAQDMLGNPVPYPNPSRNYSCINCKFRTPCIQAESGDDFMQTLQDGYIPNWDR